MATENKEECSACCSAARVPRLPGGLVPKRHAQPLPPNSDARPSMAAESHTSTRSEKYTN